MVGSLGRKDITKYTLLNEYSISNGLETKFKHVFEMLPITGKLIN